jgi:hypothetical protein
MPRPQTAGTRPVVAAGAYSTELMRQKLLRLPQSWVKVKLENSPGGFGACRRNRGVRRPHPGEGEVVEHVSR